jgi:glutaredoxin-related protein
MKVAILDDYQNVALELADWSPVASRAEITVFNDHLADPDAVVERLRPFDAICVMRERTPLRESIKRFANWPTVPQLYVKGEFVGGCDIITEMFQSGELEALLTEKGIPHEAALPESERV